MYNCRIEQIIVNEKSKDEDYRSFLICSKDNKKWEIRGYGSSSYIAVIDAMNKFRDSDNWNTYGYKLENSDE